MAHAGKTRPMMATQNKANAKRFSRRSSGTGTSGSSKSSSPPISRSPWVRRPLSHISGAGPSRRAQRLQEMHQLVQFWDVIRTREVVRRGKALHASLPVSIQGDDTSVRRAHDGMTEIWAIVRRELVALRLVDK